GATLGRPEARRRGAYSGAPRAPDRADIGLLQIGHGRQVELAGRDEGRAAPAGADPARIDRGEIAREPCRVVAGEGVAVALVQVGVVVPEVEREHALGDADADVPSGIAAVGNAVRIRRGAAGHDAGLGAVEVIARAQEPVARFAGQEEAPALRHGAARRRELRAARYIGAGGTGIEHGRRVEHRTAECDLVIDRVGAFGEALQEAQVPFDYVAVEREIAVGKAVKPEYRVDAGIKALSARIPVVPSAEIERERTEGRTEPAEDVDLGSRAIRERDALARNAHVVLQVLGDVVAWLE